MSKLLSRLEKINRGSQAPMGFGVAVRTEKTPAMALIGLLAQNYKQGANRLVRLKADGVLLEGAGLDGKLLEIAGALDTVPWGVKVEEMDGDKARGLVEKGCDFFVVSPERVTVEAVKDERAAYLLSLPSDVDDRFLRAIEDLPVDAVFMSIASTESPLTLQHLINIGSIRTMFDKYLILGVPATISAKEMEGLRDMGVDALVVDAGRSSEKVLGAIKENLLSLPRQRKLRSDRISPVLPHMADSSAVSSDEEDEGAEEEF